MTAHILNAGSGHPLTSTVMYYPSVVPIVAMYTLTSSWEKATAEYTVIILLSLYNLHMSSLSETPTG